MTQLFNNMDSEESIGKGIHGNNTPYTEQRPPDFITDGISNLIFIFLSIFFGEEGQEDTESLEEIDEGSVGKEEKDNKSPIIQLQPHNTFENIMIKRDRDEEICSCIDVHLPTIEQKATKSAKINFFF